MEQKDTDFVIKNNKRIFYKEFLDMNFLPKLRSDKASDQQLEEELEERTIWKEEAKKSVAVDAGHMFGINIGQIENLLIEQGIPQLELNGSLDKIPSCSLKGKKYKKKVNFDIEKKQQLPTLKQLESLDLAKESSNGILDFISDDCFLPNYAKILVTERDENELMELNEDSYQCI